MLEVKYTKSFKKDFKLMMKRGCPLARFITAVDLLKAQQPLPVAYRDHSLKGKQYKGCRECHIKPDWLLVYRIIDEELILELLYTGTHSDLFWLAQMTIQ